MPRRLAKDSHPVVRLIREGRLDDARAEMMALLVASGGNVREAARASGCASDRLIRWLLPRLGMEAVPGEIRERMRARWRLPPLDGSGGAA